MLPLFYFYDVMIAIVVAVVVVVWLVPKLKK